LKHVFGARPFQPPLMHPAFHAFGQVTPRCPALEKRKLAAK
jgi:hypothetical protein